MQGMQWRQWIGVVGLATILGPSAFVQAQDEKKQDSKPLVRDDDRDGVADQRSETKGNWLGIECRPVDDALRAHLDLPKDEGLVAGQIVPDSPAAKAGIKQYDVLLAANDRPLKDAKTLMEIVAQAGDKELSIRLVRSGKKETVKVTPGPRPATIQPANETDGDVFFNWLRAAEPGVLSADELRMMLLQHRLAARGPSLPDGMTSVRRDGKKITIKRGDKTWATTVDELDKLPEDLRSLAIEGATTYPPPGAGLIDHIDKRFDEVNKRIGELQKKLDDLQDRKP